jgi:hypothetical protein
MCLSFQHSKFKAIKRETMVNLGRASGDRYSATGSKTTKRFVRPGVWFRGITCTFQGPGSNPECMYSRPWVQS